MKKIEFTDEAKTARAAYQKQYKKENAVKLANYQANYWARKAREMEAAGEV
ncbi:hypothetical protein ES705_15665 [subsurface metagenome]